MAVRILGGAPLRLDWAGGLMPGVLETMIVPETSVQVYPYVLTYERALLGAAPGSPTNRDNGPAT